MHKAGTKGGKRLSAAGYNRERGGQEEDGAHISVLEQGERPPPRSFQLPPAFPFYFLQVNRKQNQDKHGGDECTSQL